MPKNKKPSKESGSESDSSPDDREPPKKKPAASKKAEEDGPSWPLDKAKFVKVREFRGKVYVDIREYYEKDDVMLPGKKGVALTSSHWTKLKELIPEIDKALADQ